MSGALLLTRDEVAALTRARTRARQIDVLRRNRVRFFIAADGWPVVPRSVVESSDAAPAETATTEPDWSAIS